MRCRRCGFLSLADVCVSCAEYLRLLERSRRTITLTLYESQKDVSRHRFRQIEIVVAPGGDWSPEIFHQYEAPPGSTYAAVVTYDRREEYLAGRLHRRYYVRRA